MPSTNSIDYIISTLTTESSASKRKAVKATKGETFIRKPSTKTPGYNIASIFGKREVKGDIGIEIEVEGNKFPKGSNSPIGSVNSQLIPKEWKYHHDGSLRGHDNAEYVFAKPLKFNEVPQAIENLWQMFEDYGSKLDDSNRTSVHVHLNAQKFHLNRLCSFVALYLSVEELLTQWCGDHRVGNLFCLRAKDAPSIVSSIKSFLREEYERLPEGLHYAGLNVHALTKFGSIEIRALRGCTDPETILNWVSILERIYKLSEDFPDPRAICDNFSGEGPMAYLEMVLGDKTSLVKDGITMNNQEIMESLYEGIRIAQDLCYCREWSEYTPVDLKPDPFLRDAKTVASSLESASQQYYDIMNSTASGSDIPHTSPSPAPAEPVIPEDIWPMPDFDDWDD